MKMIYTNENHFIVSNIKNIVEAQNISTFIKNEFAQGAVGEISAFDSWPELWIIADTDYERAINIVNTSQNSGKDKNWICNNCSEENGSAFEVCWSCQLSNS